MCIRIDIVWWADLHRIDLEQLKAAEDALRNERMACDQVFYHLRYRGIELRILPYCTEQWIAVTEYAPIEHGNFTFPQSASGWLLARIAERHSRTPRQVALNFLTRRPCIIAIPKTSRPEQIKKYLAKKSSLGKDLQPIYARLTEICSWKRLNEWYSILIRLMPRDSSSQLSL